MRWAVGPTVTAEKVAHDPILAGSFFRAAKLSAGMKIEVL